MKFYAYRFLGLLLCLWLFSPGAEATHNRAGNIVIEQIGELTIRATVYTWTKTSSLSADRDSLEIFWGDGQMEDVIRANGNGLPLDNDIKFNVYTAVHTFPGRGTYKISFVDPNRNGGILNVNFPNSESVQFYLETTYTFLNTQFQGTNNTPQLLQDPIDIGCIGEIFIHNPNAFDEEGDSLAYSLIVPFEDQDSPVPLYQYPNMINPGPLNQHFLNPITGDFTWNAPQRAGEYNIAMVIKEYRGGALISETIRDMQIFITDCENSPPEIETIDEICVIAGDTVSFDVVATDPDIDSVQLVKLQAFGGPLISNTNPAVFSVPSGFQTHPLVGTFTWATACEHINDQYYAVVFRAVDNFLDTTGLATLKTVRIKVVGPPPEDLQAEAGEDEITLSWFKPYSCEQALNNYFYGFSVWRREGSNNFPIDTCMNGLAGKGYTKVEFNTTEMENGRYVYVDSNVERGRTYCYRILGEFARISAAGFPYNIVESLPSMEACVQLGKDLPLITHVDVDFTAASTGQIIVQWSKPNALDLDTLLNPGPYTYEVHRAAGMTDQGLQLIPGAISTSTHFAHANDTVFTDIGLNTISGPYSYYIVFKVNDGDELGATKSASSIFTQADPTDNAAILSWEEMVPWDNSRYNIYRQNAIGVFDSIATTIELMYKDEGLINGETYCYYVESIGSYMIEGVVSPIRNRSQELCTIPEDDIPPCPPILRVSNICNQANASTPAEFFENFLSWTNPNEVCDETDDVSMYNIYYTQNEGGNFQIIETLTFAEDTTFTHIPDFGVAGCYTVTAIDSTGNESGFSNIVCLDNCPVFELPNTFTPNGDGSNELFVPINNRFIENIDFQVFNQWGELVFETSDPLINWNGENMSGKNLADGVYYYACKVFEQRVSGVTQRNEILNGYIELIR